MRPQATSKRCLRTLVVGMTTQPIPSNGYAPESAIRAADTESFEGADRLDAWGVFNREYLNRGLGDGFPLIAPTPELVDEFPGRGEPIDPLEVVGNLAPGYGVATVEKIAINAAMAGCQPEHLPVLVAAVQAITQTPESVFPARAISMSTSPNALMMLVSGPVVERLGVNYGRATLGPGKQSKVNTASGSRAASAPHERWPLLSGHRGYGHDRQSSQVQHVPGGKRCRKPLGRLSRGAGP